MKLDNIEKMPETPKDYTFKGDDGLWYHFDETWDSCGPYHSKDEAEQALDRYVIWLNGDPNAES